MNNNIKLIRKKIRDEDGDLQRVGRERSMVEGEEEGERLREMKKTIEGEKEKETGGGGKRKEEDG